MCTARALRLRGDGLAARNERREQEGLEVESDIGERIRPHRSEIAEVMDPYLVRRLSVHSEEWREHHQNELRKWRRQL